MQKKIFVIKASSPHTSPQPLKTSVNMFINSMLSMLFSIVFFMSVGGVVMRSLRVCHWLWFEADWHTDPDEEGKITKSPAWAFSFEQNVGIVIMFDSAVTYFSFVVMSWVLAVCVCRGGCVQQVVFYWRHFPSGFYQILPSFNVIRMVHEIEREWRRFPLHLIIFLPALFCTFLFYFLVFS